MDATVAAVGEVTPQLVMELLRPSEVALSPSSTLVKDGGRSIARGEACHSVLGPGNARKVPPPS